MCAFEADINETILEVLTARHSHSHQLTPSLELFHVPSLQVGAPQKLVTAGIIEGQKYLKFTDTNANDSKLYFRGVEMVPRHRAPSLARRHA